MEHIILTQTAFLNCKWEPSPNLKRLFIANETAIYEQRIDGCIEYIIKELARKFKMDYEVMDKIIREKNVDFFKAKADLFPKCGYIVYNEGTEKIKVEKVLRMFLVPINPKKAKSYSVDELVKQFESLSDLKKLDFLSRIEKISIKVDKI